jgi:alpha-galactosidase
MGIEGHRVSRRGDLEVWSKQLQDGGRAVVLLSRSAVVLLNRGEQTSTIAANWIGLGYPASLPASVRDLWAHKDLGRQHGSYTVEVPGHAAAMVRITP